MLDLEEAQRRILSAVAPLGAETVPLNRAAGRFLAERILSPIALPAFDNSAMDGYAVRACDVAGATRSHPVALRQVGQAAAGENFPGEVSVGTCGRLFTGSAMPPGADAVVMQEDTRLDPARPEAVLVFGGVKPAENVRSRGEDVNGGDTLAEPGQRLTAVRMSLLAAVGLTTVSVGEEPRAGLLATGSELQEGGEPLAPGHVFESNRLALATLLESAGATPRLYPLVADTLAATRTALEAAFADNDVVLTSGGASVGELDFVKAALHELGGELEFWKVAIKPGKPFVFGRRRGKILFGLPGNPASALVTFRLLVRPALARLQGASDAIGPTTWGRLGEALTNPGDRRHFVRVTLDATGTVWSAGTQASHVLKSLAESVGLVDVAPQLTLPAGSWVRVLRWD
ncbi:MAG: molybdopterin molybdotransferase MoeA [Limisphaerales bacterium]